MSGCKRIHVECKICAHRAHIHTFSVDIDLRVQFGVHFLARCVKLVFVPSSGEAPVMSIHGELFPQKFRRTASRTLVFAQLTSPRRDTSRQTGTPCVDGVRNGRRHKAVGGSGSCRTLRTIGQTGTSVEAATKLGTTHM